MAISLNNHETRIKALENKATESKFSEIILWSGKSSGNGTVTLPQPITDFDLIKIIGLESGYGGYYPSIQSVTQLKSLKKFGVCMLGSPNINIEYVSDTSLKTWGYSGWIVQISGIKIK